MDYTTTAETNLRWMLRDIQHHLDNDLVTDLHIEGVGEATIDRGLGLEPIVLPYTLRDLEDIAILAAALTGQDIAADVPIVSTRFPGGERVQIQRPPAVADGKIAFSIRRPMATTPSPDELDYADPAWRYLIGLAVKAKKNIVFSGAVGSGKTTCLRAFTHDIPRGFRIITIEDTPELINLPVPVTSLFYSKGGQSVAATTATQLVEAALRMGPDGILMQELRDDAAASFLGMLESGHWGMTTTHAASAAEARDRIRGLVKQHAAGRFLNDTDVAATLARSVNMVVHCVRDGARRFIAEVA